MRNRQTIRLKKYDYSLPGAYFVTICAYNKEYLFGEIINGKIFLNRYGKIVHNCWYDLTNHYKNIKLDYFIIMPNHFHGILNIVGAGFKPALGLKRAGLKRAGLKPAPTTGLTEIIRAFKTFSARYINELRETTGIAVWQRNYYEHIIRDESELNKIREYIRYNPMKWQDDDYCV